MRPVLLYLESCRNVLLQGVTFQNSPNWCLHPLLCENLIVDQVMVRNPAYAQNGDAIDVESCRNVLVVNSSFDAGDDGICLKSGRDEQGRRRGRPTENVVVDGCTVFNGHGGFVVGSEMSGGVRNIWVNDCQFLGTDAGLRFKSCRGRGGVVENIYIRNISMADILGDAVTFDLFYGGKSVIEQLESGERINNIAAEPVGEGTPVFRNIDIGKKKVDAVAEMLRDINPEIDSGLRLVDTGYTGQRLSGYVFLCVDNIELRREITEKCKDNPYIKAMFDFRMGLTSAQHYAADMSNAKMVESFLKSMAFSHAEAKEAMPVSACNIPLSVCPTVRSIVALGVANFVNFAKGLGLKKQIQIDAFEQAVTAF